METVFYFSNSISKYLLVPGAVFDLQITEVEATEIRITWRKPRQPNGIINQYRVRVSDQETGVVLENTLLTGQDEVLHFHCPLCQGKMLVGSVGSRPDDLVDLPTLYIKT